MNIYSYIPEMVVMACGVYVDNKYVYVLSVHGREGIPFESTFIDVSTGLVQTIGFKTNFFNNRHTDDCSLNVRHFKCK